MIDKRPDVRRPGVWLAGIVVLGAGLRLYDVGGVSLWNDELFSRYYPRMGTAFLWGPGMLLEPNPPLYYSLLAGWMALFGDGAAAMRLLSVAASVPGLVVVFLLGRSLFGTGRAGLLGALCLALSAANVFYAQEARAYALEGTAIAAALLGMAGFLRRPAGWGPLALYAGAAVVAVYCHLTAALFVMAANGAVVASMVGRPPLLGSRGLARWCGANVAVGLACLPLVRTVLSPDVGHSIAWVAPVSVTSLAYAAVTLVAGPAAGDAVVPVGSACAVGLVAVLLRSGWRPGRIGLAVAVVAPLLFFGLMVGASVWRPVLLPRTVAWLSVPFSLVLGGALARLGMGWRVAVGIALCGGLAAQVHAGQALKEDLRSFVRGLAPHLAPPALIVVMPPMPASALVAYAPGVGPLVQAPGEGPDTVEHTVVPQLLGVRRVTWVQVGAEVGAAVAGGRPVWLIIRGDENGWLRARLAELPAPRERVEGELGFALGWKP